MFIIGLLVGAAGIYVVVVLTGAGAGKKAEKLERATKQMQKTKAELDAKLAQKEKAEAVIANATKRLREL